MRYQPLTRLCLPVPWIQRKPAKRRGGKSASSTRELLRQVRAQAGELFRRQSPKNTAPLLGNVSGDVGLVAEHILLEKSAPGAPGSRRQGADAEYSVQQCVERRIGECAVAVRVMPPVVHEHIEGVQRLDVVPPLWWNECRISGRRSSHVGRPPC